MLTERIYAQKHLKRLGLYEESWLRLLLPLSYQPIKLVRPILEYGSIVWNPHQVHLADRLERIQNKALCFVYSKYSRRDSITALGNAAGTPTLACRRRVAAMKFLFFFCFIMIA